MEESNELIKNLVEKHGRTRNALMPILQDIVAVKQYLEPSDIAMVAEELDLSAADVYGTATFYTFLDTVPRGKNVIRVCKTISCYMSGKDEIINALEKVLNIKVGETTLDKQFTLLTANCMGWCHKGPVMLINDDVYHSLTPETAVEIVQQYKEKSKN
ncbi:MAG TPA: NADH-quinone oxidoreductase subunit NuoE [Bacteroidales bacterium]|mgnify:FL=1|jgi:NADH:ubiquinone oxidoreductase subunit E|nr:NADH-quinone oxidoreductase subunit NuoE [Bacteroidales bacterium]OQC47500.1 MAG: NADH-quinone oxidoreductase subunit E [Bacteroidetes bacterium ADurb.Bin035]MBP8946701.1 NADH-quinone oxidoreductase subunit NuoE [Bacteroidales bacterium]HNQ20872.1 NADH-quinone oxidoreductase subunit NuoE [Bacteroidales bacterium]HOC40448.1 NADH-quinone oxidoreductase subunit NuoE [Bacteroidales bacterium]